MDTRHFFESLGLQVEGEDGRAVAPRKVCIVRVQFWAPDDQQHDGVSKPSPRGGIRRLVVDLQISFDQLELGNREPRLHLVQMLHEIITNTKFN